MEIHGYIQPLIFVFLNLQITPFLMSSTIYRMNEWKIYNFLYGRKFQEGKTDIYNNNCALHTTTLVCVFWFFPPTRGDLQGFSSSNIRRSGKKNEEEK